MDPRFGMTTVARFRRCSDDLGGTEVETDQFGFGTGVTGKSSC